MRHRGSQSSQARVLSRHESQTGKDTSGKKLFGFQGSYGGGGGGNMTVDMGKKSGKIKTGTKTQQ